MVQKSKDRVHIFKVRWFYLICSFIILYSCNSTRYLEQDKYLLKKNTISVDTDKIEAEELESILKQKPNRKWFGVYPFYLYTYNLGQHFPIESWGNWLSNNVGEAPVALDTTLIDKSIGQLHTYMVNNGFFNNRVTYSIDTINYKKRKLKVEYSVLSNEIHRLNNISVQINDNALAKDIIESNKKSLLHKGDRYDVDEFEKDRERLVEEMKNKGFYNFSKDRIVFKVDTHITDNKVNVVVEIKKREIAQNNKLIKTNHKKYIIDIVNVSEGNEQVPTFELERLNFSPSLAEKISTDFLKDNIYLIPGELYAMDNMEKTYSRLIALKLFKQVTIQAEDISEENDTLGKLKINIKLPFLPYNSISLQTDGTNRGGNLGISVNGGLKNKNTFRSGEILSFNGNAGLEVQYNTGSDQSTENVVSIFNTVNYGAEISLLKPQLLFPSAYKFNKRLRAPRTELVTSYDFQIQPLFQRNVIGGQWRYSFKTTPLNNITFSPADINVVKIIPTEAFEEILSNLNNPYLSNTYQDHFIAGGRLQYFSSNRKITPLVNYYTYKIGFEGAGNILRAVYNSVSNNDSLPGRIFGVRFAQYIKTDVDLRAHFVLSKSVRVVYRLYSGVGVPLQNSSTLPFEKSFFGGGANGIRAWQIRSLGPGSFSNPNISSFYRIGDIQLEANAELRFDITDMLEGALFTDVGNIWLYNRDGERPGGTFYIDRFYKELAVGSGVGARLDFNFFLVRFDWGFKLRDPSYIEGERWFFEPKDQFNEDYPNVKKSFSNLSIGIGYPF